MKKQYVIGRVVTICCTILLPAVRVFASSTTFSDLFINLDSSLNQIWAFLTATCYLVGLSLTLSAVYKLKKFGEKISFEYLMRFKKFQNLFRPEFKLEERYTPCFC